MPLDSPCEIAEDRIRGRAEAGRDAPPGPKKPHGGGPHA